MRSHSPPSPLSLFITSLPFLLLLLYFCAFPLFICICISPSLCLPLPIFLVHVYLSPLSFVSLHLCFLPKIRVYVFLRRGPCCYIYIYKTRGFADSRRGVCGAVGGPDGSVSRDETGVLLSAAAVGLRLPGGPPKSAGEGEPVSLPTLTFLSTWYIPCLSTYLVQ